MTSPLIWDVKNHALSVTAFITIHVMALLKREKNERPEVRNREE